MDNPHWQFVKKRTADPGGAVYVNTDGTRYRRTGGPALAEHGYPVPRILDDGVTDDGHVSPQLARLQVAPVRSHLIGWSTAR